MSDDERQNIIDSLFPVGKERWIKVEIRDQEKAIKTLWMPMDEKRAQPYVDKFGFRVTALGCRDEYTPQISAIMDLKGEVVGQLYGYVPDYILENVNNLFKQKMDELKTYTIKTEITEP